MSDRVLAVIVSHNPELENLSSSIECLLTLGCTVLLIDNASCNQSEIEQACVHRSEIDSSEVDSAQVHFSPLKKNVGLGAAHNLGIKKAREESYDYILLLDQDTLISESYLESLLLAQKAKTNLGLKVSAVGGSYAHGSQNESVYIRFSWLKFSRHGSSEQDADGCIESDFLISSGSLISVRAVEDIGDMDETLFIDHIDTEWFLRARSKGYQAFGVPSAKMEHGLGEQTHSVNLAGRQRNVPQHKPFRYYYIFRNSILLYRRAYVSGLWKWNDLQRLFMIFTMFGILKAPRRQNLRMMFKGIAHGLRGKSGALLSSSQERSSAAGLHK